jgi:hypothetical protein
VQRALTLSKSCTIGAKNRTTPRAVDTVSANLVTGIAEMMLKLGRDHPDDPHGICGELTRGALVQTFVNWAEKHPEERGSSDHFGVLTALAEGWHCPTK